MNVRIRRYAEATNYAKVLTGVYNGIPKGENGMIIKYQNPPHGIARRDAIQDYRPEIPFSPIKQPVKPYMPTQQPILSPDNRTGWEKEVSRQIKADRAKNDNLYGNQHTWNWFAPFTNARITKDNASAMFDFDKSAAMSTFAIGQGIASPVTTATSIAGSLVGAGIGNKVAGGDGKNYVIIVYDDGTVKERSIVGPVSSISTGPYDYCCVGASYQGGARIYTFLATSVPDSLTYYTPGMFTPSAVIQGFHSSPRSVVYSTTSNYTYVSANPTGTRWTAATTRPQLTGLTKGLYVNEAGTNTFMLIGNNMKSVSTDRGNNWTTSTLGEYTLTDLIYVDSNWYAIGSNGTKRLLLQNTASTFDQSNKILDLPDYSIQVIKINT